MRKIYLSCDIDEDSFREFCQQMDEFELRNANKPIEVILNSIGGNGLDAIAFAERIRLSPCEVNITVFGLAGSAAVLVLAAGDHRRMTKNSWVMTHEDSGSYKNIKTSDLEREARQAKLFEYQWAELLAYMTHTDSKKWRELHTRYDNYLTPEDCKSLGLIEEII